MTKTWPLLPASYPNAKANSSQVHGSGDSAVWGHERPRPQDNSEELWPSHWLKLVLLQFPNPTQQE